MIAFDRDALEEFRALASARLGLQFDDGKTDVLANVLRERLEARRLSAATYLRSLTGFADVREELRALAERLTVPETYFFRNPDHFRAFAEVAVPERAKAQSPFGRLRILSAGCASGEEPYSLAILLHRRFPDLASGDLALLGVDMNPAMLARAAAARYSSWALRETPEDLRGRYFRAQNKEFVLLDAVRESVCFEEGNLTDEEAPFWRKDHYDVAFCRNVLMYLRPDAAQAVVDRLGRALAPGGFLFLGHAETLRGLSQEFHLRHTHDTFYYQKREAADLRPIASAAPAPSASTIPTLAFEGTDASWVDVIRTASERIETLVGARAGPSAQDEPRSAREAPPPARPVAELGAAFELLRQERFHDALEALGGLSAESAADPDAELLRAVLLTNCGELVAADAVCGNVLAVDDLNAGAHYVKALCREHSRDPQGAMEHDQIAAYLDATFAMPHLHLGLLAKRTGDLALARRELAQAQLLLMREDASRILLFGGGFSREALAELARRELASMGGHP